MTKTSKNRIKPQLTFPDFISATNGYYDWTIADLIGGIYHPGQSEKGTANAGGATAVAGGPILDLTPRGVPKIPVSEKDPPLAIELIVGILKTNDIPERIPLITTEECAPDETCNYKPRASGRDGNKNWKYRARLARVNFRDLAIAQGPGPL